MNNNATSSTTTNNAQTQRTSSLRSSRKRKADEAGLLSEEDLQTDLVQVESSPSLSTGSGTKRKGSARGGKATEEKKETINEDLETTGSNKKSSKGRIPQKDGKVTIEKKEDLEEEEEANECVICMEELNMKEEATVDACTHVFCYDCIDKWSKTENTCPLCKKRFHQIRVKNPKGTTPKGRKKRQKTKRVQDRNQRYATNFNEIMNDIVGMEGGSVEMFMGGMEMFGLLRQLHRAEQRTERERERETDRPRRGFRNNTNNGNETDDYPMEFLDFLMGRGLTGNRRGQADINPTPRRLQGTREFASRQNTSNQTNPQFLQQPPFMPAEQLLPQRHVEHTLSSGGRRVTTIGIWPTPSHPMPADPISVDMSGPGPRAPTPFSIPAPMTPIDPRHLRPTPSVPAPTIPIDLRQETPPINMPSMDRLVSFSNSLNNNGRATANTNTNTNTRVRSSRSSSGPFVTEVIEIMDNDDDDVEGVEIIGVIPPRRSLDP